MRDIITLGCTDCKQRNYTSTKNKRKTPQKLELKKFCPFCRAHTTHKETK
ncbi:MAG: 50S ribosomal protein L33 [Desulfobulbaceae bacterium]|nr:50S ribosomal protein L33 [Desulfobulbaceae bacterium]MDP2104838.1 50S ribosomal protein L33 [Desulfobulbaceae bacterium]